MNWVIALAVCFVPTLALAGEPAKKHELTYKRDGDTLIVSTTIKVLDARHLVFATVENTDSLVASLRYTVTQNSDELPIREKDVTIEWRITGERAGFHPGGVTGQVIQLSTEELKQLGGKALDLVGGPKEAR